MASRVKATIFLRLLLPQASISRGWTAWRETGIHSYVACKGHAVCSRVKAKTERNSGNRIISDAPLLLCPLLRA